MSFWRRTGEEDLLPFTDALDALGSDGAMGTAEDEVPLDAIVGSVARPAEYDVDFRPRRRDERHADARKRMRAGDLPPAVELVRLGDLYFVSDGHHRIAAAKEQGWTTIPARVRRICTVAYARCCLRLADLERKGAERRFREAVPLPEATAGALDLARPADWDTLRAHAERWADEHGKQGDCCSHEVASAWWMEVVAPELERLGASSGAELDIDTVQMLVGTLANRDDLGGLGPSEARHHRHDCCC